MSEPLKNAAKFMDEAKKKGSKGIFNWSPDYDEAGDLYGKAAQIYRNNNALNECVKAYELQAEMFEKADHLGLAAKALETAGNTMMDNGKPVLAYPLLERAAKYYIRDNKAQMASSVLNRCSRGLLDTEDPSLAVKAVELLNGGITALENDDKHILTKDMYRMMVLAQLRAGKPLDAIASLKKQISTLMRASLPDQVAKNGLEIVIIALSLGDGVLAGRYLQELSGSATGFAGSEEFNRASDLLCAFDDRDQDRLTEVGKMQLFTFLIPEVSRMAKKLKVEGSPVRKAPGGLTTATGVNNGSVSRSQQPQPVNDDDEDIR